MKTSLRPTDGATAGRAVQHQRRHRRFGRLAVVGVAVVALVGACGGSGSQGAESEADESSATAAPPATTAAPPSPAAAEVAVKQFQFMPGELVVKGGTQVTWTNQDDILHTATSGATPGSPDGTFDGPMDGPGTTYTYTFDQPGTYAYFCSRHNSMTGKVIVE